MLIKMSARSTAYHEAGHAVVAQLVGLPFIDVSLVQTETEFGRLKIDSAHTKHGGDLLQKQAMVGLAGYLAERTFDPKSDPAGMGQSADFTAVANLLGHSWRDHAEWKQLVGAIRVMTEKLVQDNWPAIESVAKALLSRESLTAAEVAVVIESRRGVPKRRAKRKA